VSFLAICPTIARDGDLLVASTSGLGAFLTLGLALRRVAIDPKAKTITVRQRMGWLFASERTFRFDQLRAIIYRYEDWNPATALSMTGDSKDCYVVGLAVFGHRDPIHLFRFVGEGSFQNNSYLPDWYYWQEFLFDARGSQEQESKNFVNLLASMTGASVSPS
jgi:hypothetical protein